MKTFSNSRQAFPLRNPSVTSSTLNAAAPLVRITRIPSTRSDTGSVTLKRNSRITTLTDPPKRRLPTVQSHNEDDDDDEEVVLREKSIVVKPFKPPPKTEPFSSLTITTKPKSKTGVSTNLIKGTKPVTEISVKPPPKSNLILNNNNKLVVNKNIRERDRRVVEAPQQRKPPQSIFGALSKKR